MLLVILGVGIITLVAGLITYIPADKGRWEMNPRECTGFALIIIGAVISVISVFVTIIVGVNVSNFAVIDEKILMYEEENTAIEEQISEVVMQYQQYETNIFANAKTESAIMLVSLYPELKSDTLVSKQISIYVDNNMKIKELKESKISGSVYRWWLYFGK